MEVWGYCSECARWYYIEHRDASHGDASARCPVCVSKPQTVEQRPAEYP